MGDNFQAYSRDLTQTDKFKREPGNYQISIYDDILIDVLCLHRIQPKYCNQPISFGMGSATMIKFTLQSCSDDMLLNILSNSLNSTERDINAKHDNVARLKVTLIMSAEETINFIFPTEIQYWLFISSIKQAYYSKLITFDGKCSMKKTRKTVENTLFSADSNSYDISYDIRNSMLTIYRDASDSTVVDVTKLRAMTLSADYIDPLPLHFTTSNFRLCKITNGHHDTLPLDLSKFVIQTISATRSYGPLSALSNEGDTFLVDNTVTSHVEINVLHINHATGESKKKIGSGKVPLNALLNESLTGNMEVSIPLQFEDHRNVLRLVVHSAEHLVTGGLLYCVVYVVDKDGNTHPMDVIDTEANHKEGSVSVCDRTQTVAATKTPNDDFSVSWNQEFLFRPTRSIDNIESVLIKIKDASANKLGFTFGRHRHVAQVQLPLGVFVPQTESAMLHLPLDYTERMKSDANFDSDGLGEIVVNTQIVPVPEKSIVTEVSTSKSSYWPNRFKPSKAEVVSAIGSLEEEEHSALTVEVVKLDCAIHASVPCNTWFPCKCYSSSNCELFGKDDVLYCLFGPNEVVLRVGAGGEEDEGERRTSISWTNVANAFDITESVLLLALAVSVSVKNLTPVQKPEVRRRSSLTSLLTSSQISLANLRVDGDAKILHILVAPCPSRYLGNVVRHRMMVFPLRHRIVELLENQGLFADVSDWSLVSSTIEDSAILQFVNNCANILSDGAKLLETIDDNPSHEVETRVKLYCKFLREACRKAVKRLSAEGQDALNNYPQAISMDRTLQAWAFSVSEMTKLRHEPCAPESVHLQALHSTVTVEDICALLDVILASCAVKLNHFILCSALENVKISNKNPDALRLQLIIREHFNAMYHVIDTFISSKKALSHLSGQQNKINFLKYCADFDSKYCKMVQNILSLVDMEMRPQPYVLGMDKLEDAIKLYSSILVSETRKWLAKTIAHSKTFKENEYGLPWDVFTLEEKYISSLPEALRFQLNVYTALSESFEGQDVDAHFATTVVEQVLMAVCESLMLLAGEYKLALQSRHWETVAADAKGAGAGAGGEEFLRQKQADQLVFLISVANDCFRLSTVHVPELLRMSSSSSCPWGVIVTDTIAQVVEECQSTSEFALKQLVKVIFFDLRPVITQFDSHWVEYVASTTTTPARRSTSKVSPVGVMVATLGDFFRDIKSRLVGMLFFDLLESCAEVCCLRYIMLLKYLHEKNDIVQEPHRTQMLLDISSFIDIFSFECTFQIHHHMNPLSNLLGTVADAIALITAPDMDDPDFLEVCSRMHTRKVKILEEDDVATYMKGLQCIVSLRGDCMGMGEKAVSGGGIAKKIMALISADVEGDQKIISAAKKCLSQNRGKKAHTENVITRIFDIYDTQSSSGISFTALTTREQKHLNILRTVGLMEYTRQHSYDEKDRDRDRDMDRDREVEERLERKYVSRPVVSHLPILPINRSTKWTHDGSSDIIVVSLRNITARNLVTKAVLGRCNPYVVVTLDAERLKTGVKWNSNQPAWPDEIRFRKRTSDGSDKMLHVKVYDKERIARKTLIGAVTVNISVIDLHPIDSWFALEGGVVGCSGEVHLTIEQIL